MILTPRYEYNQIMYKVSLDDQRLFLPVPVYLVRLDTDEYDLQLRETVAKQSNWNKIEKILFFAFPPDRKLRGMVPVYKTMKNNRAVLSLQGVGNALFYALSAETGREGEKKSVSTDDPDRYLRRIAGSQAVSSLYYKPHAIATEAHYYTAKSQESDTAVTSAIKLCKVWQNPCSLLILDQDAQPVQQKY